MSARRAAGARAHERDRAPTRACPSSSCAARARACGTTRATSTWTSCAASRSRTSGTATRAWWRAVREQVGRLMHVSNLFYTEPAMRLAERLSRVEPRRQGVLLQLRRRGQRGGDQARAQGPRAAGDVVVVHGAFHGRTYGALSATPQEAKQAPFAPLVPGFRAVAPEPEALRAAVDERTAAVLLEPIQGESGVHVLSEELLRRRARGLRRARRGADLRRDPVRHGPHRHAVGLRADRRACPTRSRVAKALGGGLPIGALVTGERLADVLAPGDHGSTFAGGPVIARGGAGGARGDRRSARCSRACASSAQRLAGGPRARCPHVRVGARARADARVRARRVGARGRRAARCSSSAWSSTPPARPRCGCCRR